MSDDDKIVNLFSKSGSTRHLTPQELVDRFPEFCEKNDIAPTRLVMVVVEESEGAGMKIRTFHANAPSTVSVYMLELAKGIVVDEMLHG